MRTAITISNKTRFIILLLFTFFMIALQCKAQYYNRYKRNKNTNFILGTEAAFSTYSFTMKSDISQINGVRLVEEGTALGLVTGCQWVRLRTRFGVHQTKVYVYEKYKTKSIEGLVNIYPAKIGSSVKSKLDLYLVAGLSQRRHKFIGDYVPLPTKEIAEPKKTQGGKLPCTEAMPPLNPTLMDPDAMVAAIKPAEEKQTPPGADLGTIMTRTAVAGVGLQSNYKRGWKFFNFYGEILYNVPLHYETTNNAFANTSFKNAIVANIGIIAGLSK